jgi:hypothetical protein
MAERTSLASAENRTPDRAALTGQFPGSQFRLGLSGAEILKSISDRSPGLLLISIAVSLDLIHLSIF